MMDRALNRPVRPFITIIGGAKISDKISVLEHIMGKVDTLLIGGGMASNFIRAMDYGVGDSLIEPDRVGLARELLERARQQGTDLLLPEDVVVGDSFTAEARSQTVAISGIPDGWRVMDIGPRTIEQFEARLRGAKTVIWNGPMGVFEYPRFSQGTKAMANTLAALEATTIIGGGSTAEAVVEMGLSDRMTHVSTGGGASLEFLEGKTLPGVAVLQDREG